LATRAAFDLEPSQHVWHRAVVPKEQEILSGWIETALSHATIDLGITWNDGIVYPSGARALDKSLIEEPLKWLADFPNVRIDYRKAIESYINQMLVGVIITATTLSKASLERL
jgi:hypothetical protein